MPKIKIYSLFPDQTARTSKGQASIELPNYIVNKLRPFLSFSKPQAHSLLQEPVFAANKPVRFESWEEFTRTPAPMPDLKTNKRLMVVPANHLYPLSFNEAYTLEEQHQQGEARDEEARQLASAKAASAAAGVGLTHLVMVFLGIAVVVLCLIMGVIAADAAGWLTPETPPVEGETTWHLSHFHEDALT